MVPSIVSHRMGGYFKRLEAPVWSTDAAAVEVDSPTWTQIESAIRSLDGWTRNDLYLHPDPDDLETYFAVAGGTDNRYLVFFCHGNESFDEAITPDAEDTRVELVVGGQPGDFALRDLVTLDQAVEGARSFHMTGELSAGQSWRHR